MIVLLWILTAVLVIAGVIAVAAGHGVFGAVLIVLGLLVGPGGVNAVIRRST